MMHYLVTYDVEQVDADTYPDLYDELTRLGAVQALESVYLVDYEGNAASLFERLMKHLTERTKLLVVEIKGDNNWWMIRREGGIWMKDRNL